MFTKTVSQRLASKSAVHDRRIYSLPPESSADKKASNKPFTIPDDASLVQFVECYGYLVVQPQGYLWLTGLVPKHQRQIVADRVRQRLEAGRAGKQAGSVLVAL